MSESRLTATSGTFEKFPLWHILYDAQVLKFTGTLALLHPAKKKSLLFETGRIVGSRSSLEAESALHVLIASKRVSLKDIKALGPDIESKETLAQINLLMKEGLVQPHHIQEILDEQVTLRIAEIFDWKEGRFAFVSQMPPDVVKVPHSLEILDIIVSILLKRGKTPILDLSAVIVLPTELSYVIEAITQAPMKLRHALKKHFGQKETADIQKEIATMDAKEVSAYLHVFQEMKLLRFSKQQAAQTTVQVKNSPKVLSQKDIDERYRTFVNMDYYALLQVQRTAKEDEIKKSFIGLAKQYHPDQLPESCSAEMKKSVGAVFAMISQAHATLSDMKRRLEYDAELAVKESGFDSKQADRILEAEMMFLKAEAFAKKGDFDSAVKQINSAIALNDTEPEYHMLLGWSLFKLGSIQKNAIQIKKGKEHIQRTIAMRNDLVQAHYYLGFIAKSEGDMALAKNSFEKTLSLNRNHQEANSELRVIMMREQKGTGVKSMFQKKKS